MLDIQKYDVDDVKFKDNYLALANDKEKEINENLLKLDELVNAELEAMRETIKEKIKQRICDEIDIKYNDKIKIYEDCLIEKIEVVEPIVEAVEQPTIVVEQPIAQVVEPTPTITL